MQGPTPPLHPQSKGGVPETNCPPSGSWSTCGSVMWSEIRKKMNLWWKRHLKMAFVWLQYRMQLAAVALAPWNESIPPFTKHWFYGFMMIICLNGGGDLTCCALHRGKNVFPKAMTHFSLFSTKPSVCPGTGICNPDHFKLVCFVFFLLKRKPSKMQLVWGRDLRKAFKPTV